MDDTLDKRLKKMRLKAGLTQAQLAEKLDISPSTIGMYEQGRREPNPRMLSKICKELNAPGDYMLNIKNEIVKSKDFNELIDEFTEYIKSEKNLTINGKPLKDEERAKITNAFKVAIAVIIYDNKNNK